jgi:hypothetical protein
MDASANGSFSSVAITSSTFTDALLAGIIPKTPILGQILIRRSQQGACRRYQFRRTGLYHLVNDDFL